MARKKFQKSTQKSLKLKIQALQTNMDYKGRFWSNSKSSSSNSNSNNNKRKILKIRFPYSSMSKN